MYRILSLAAGCLMLLCLQGICLAAEERVSLQPMCDLDGKTKDDLVKLREKSMIYSAFYRYDYQPKIFDRYDAKEKWIGNRYSCYRNRFYDGNSEASIWLKNPNILVHPLQGRYTTCITEKRIIRYFACMRNSCYLNLKALFIMKKKRK